MAKFQLSGADRSASGGPSLQSRRSFGDAMNDFGKLAAQIRGARALLGWSQAYMAEGVNVRRAVIADLESCQREPPAALLLALMKELSAAGIIFTEKGVEFLRWPPRPYVPTGCVVDGKRIRRKLHSRARRDAGT